jgi:hypothetical protein
MQEICTYGSVRGAPGNRRSYRDPCIEKCPTSETLLMGYTFSCRASCDCLGRPQYLAMRCGAAANKISS